MTLIYPGPASIEPKACPGGVVVHVYAVPTQRLLLQRHLRTQMPIEHAAELDYDDCSRRLRDEDGEYGLCLVAYDGDTGHRGIDWPEDE